MMMNATPLRDSLHRVLGALAAQKSPERREIIESGYFDAEWYLSQYADLREEPEALRDPLGHYLTLGTEQGRNPGPRFSTSWYLAEYPDVKAAGINPLVHYVRYGRSEGRRPTPELSGLRRRFAELDGGASRRVIYRTRRSHDLTHTGRIRRLDGEQGAAAWQAFSREFSQTAATLSRDEAEYLHNRGFLPDKKRLYQLPNRQVDSFVSDLQVRLLPGTNGSAQRILDDKVLQYQMLGRWMPVHASETKSEWRWGNGLRVSVVLMVDPARNLLQVLSAIALFPSTWPHHLFGNAQLSPATGRTRSVVYHRRSGEPHRIPVVPPWLATRFTSTWARIEREVLAPLRGYSIFSFVQLDVLVRQGNIEAVELTGCLSAPLFQVHGPLMQSDAAVEFIREFGI